MCILGTFCTTDTSYFYNDIDSIVFKIYQYGIHPHDSIRNSVQSDCQNTNDPRRYQERPLMALDQSNARLERTSTPDGGEEREGGLSNLVINNMMSWLENRMAWTELN